jgi:hypothetical protein
MAVKRQSKETTETPASETADPTSCCPACGRPGEWQKCKLVCTNPRCSVHIILSCVD